MSGLFCFYRIILKYPYLGGFSRIKISKLSIMNAINLIKSKFHQVILGWMCVLVLSFLSACTDKDKEDNFALEREIPGLRIEFEGLGEESKYFVSWDEPVAMLTEPDKFKSYYVWVVLDAEAQEAFLERETPSSSDLKDYNETSWSKDILLFKPTIKEGELPRFEITSELINEANERGTRSITLVVWADFGIDFRAARIPTKFYLQDVFPADQVGVRVETGPEFAKLSWTRPEDLFSRIPNRENGMIFGYNISVSYVDQLSAPSELSAVKWQLDSSSSQLDSQHVLTESFIKTKNDGQPLRDNSDYITNKPNDGNDYGTLNIAILDSGRSGEADDEFVLYLDGFTPIRTYELSIIALDSLGNTLDLESNSFISPLVMQFSTTDTTRPELADNLQLKPDSVDASRRIFYWLPITNDPSGISHYIVTQIDSSYQGFDTTTAIIETLNDTLINLDGDDSSAKPRAWLQDTLDYFIPGRSVEVQVQAVDRTGYKSFIRSISQAVAPLLSDVCPELNMVALQDSLGIYCIDQLERRVGQNTANPTQFKTDIRAQDASDFCQAKSSLGDWTYDLCSDEVWQNTCIGQDSARLYGLVEYESTATSEGLLFSDCNHGTNDSDGAHHSQINTRSTRCVTESGVYDMAGHYQEWVRSSSIEASSPYSLKGGTYAQGDGVSASALNRIAQCRSSNFPIRQIPRYVDTTTTLVRLNDGRVLLGMDSLLLDTVIKVAINDTLDVASYTDQILLFKITDGAEVLYTDFPVDYNEYRRDSVHFAQVYFAGLEATITSRLNEVHILETVSQSAVNFHKSPSISFRCCARKN